MVLLVSDDRGLAVALGELLRTSAYRAEVEPSGERALARLRAGHRPTLVLVDHAAWHRGGAALVEAVRRDPALLTLPTLVFSTAPAPAPLGVVSLGMPLTRENVLAIVRRHAQTFTELPRVAGAP